MIELNSPPFEMSEVVDQVREPDIKITSAAVLPEVALLEIFKLVDRETLALSVRAVCKQWRRLCEYRALWRGTSFILDHPCHLKTTILQFRAAPHVEGLTVVLRPETVDCIQRNLVDYAWRGKLEALEMDVSRLSEGHDIWGNLLRKFEEDIVSFGVNSKEHGRLPQGYSDEFVRFISNAPHLKVLDISNCADILAYEGPLCDLPRALETLTISAYSGITSTSFLVAIVSASRKSLRNVRMSGIDRGDCCPGPVARELGRCPLLEHLVMPMCREMAALSTCAALTDLSLYSDRRGHNFTDESERLMRCLAGPAKLCRLSFSFLYYVSSQVVSAVKLHTKLKYLSVLGFRHSEADGLLRCLPDLEELQWPGFPGDTNVLRAMAADPGMVPKLRQLLVRANFNEGKPHEALDELCRRRPHLRIWGNRHYGARFDRMYVCKCLQCVGSRSVEC